MNKAIAAKYYVNHWEFGTCNICVHKLDILPFVNRIINVNDFFYDVCPMIGNMG